MTRLFVLLYRLYFAPKRLVEGMVRERPSAPRALNIFKTMLRRYVLPERRVWLQVQKGLSRGMWMRLGLPDEARYWRGEHDLEVERALLTAVYPGAVVYDVGAHLGYFALGAARLVGEYGRVVAFDGDPDNVVRLREHTLKNDLVGRLETVHAAVWSMTASDGISFRRGNKPRAQGGVEADGCRPVLGNGGLIKVPAITLDDFIAGGGPVPNIVKIDVEGGEAEVMRGATRLFADHRPLLIAEVHQVHAAEQMERWLNGYQYCAKWIVGHEPYPRQFLAWPPEYDGRAWIQRLEERE